MTFGSQSAGIFSRNKSIRRSLVQRREVTLRIDSRGATHSGGGHSLTIHMIGTIARHKNAGYIRGHPFDRADVAILVHIDDSFEQLCVRDMADGNKDSR